MNRKRNQNHSLEDWNLTLDRALRNLPERSAPADLMPQVMAKIRSLKEEGEQTQSWWQWPLWFRIPACALTLVLIALGSFYMTQVYETRVGPGLERIFSACRSVLEAFINVLPDLGIGINLEIFQYSLLAIGLLSAAMYITCISVGTLIYRTVRR